MDDKLLDLYLSYPHFDKNSSNASLNEYIQHKDFFQVKVDNNPKVLSANDKVMIYGIHDRFIFLEDINVIVKNDEIKLTIGNIKTSTVPPEAVFYKQPSLLMDNPSGFTNTTTTHGDFMSLYIGLAGYNSFQLIVPYLPYNDKADNYEHEIIWKIKSNTPKYVNIILGYSIIAQCNTLDTISRNICINIDNPKETNEIIKLPQAIVTVIKI